MAEHSYQKVGLLDNDRSESFEEEERAVQRNDSKSWMWRHLSYFTFHLTLLLLYALVTFLVIRQTKFGVCKQTDDHILTYSK
jgi:hypothetical protein